MLGKKLRMLAMPNSIRSLGIGGCLSGGLAGALFLIYRVVLPPTLTLNEIVFVTALLGAACYQVLFIVIVRPLRYYFSLLELYLLRHLIGEPVRAEITCELTFRYFLGDSYPCTSEFFSKAGKKCGKNTVQDYCVARGASEAARGDGSAAC